MVRLYFTKRLNKGALKGLYHQSSMPFVSYDAAADWVRCVKIPKIERRNGWRLIDYSFQNYHR